MTTANYNKLENYKATEAKAFKASGRAGRDVLKSNKKNTTKRDKKGIDSQAISSALASAAELAGQMKDPGLGVSPGRTKVRSGASTGASYINSFDEYNTDDAAGRK